MESTEEFARCYTCGTWTEARDLLDDLYCSKSCGKRFTRCTVCGRYVETEEPKDGFVCSAECSRTYSFAHNRYVLSEETV